MVNFSHKYSKMPEGWEKSKLLQIFTTHKMDLSYEFELYDTHIEGGGYYKLPDGVLFVLLLQTVDKGELWTTIRRCTKSKYYWYRGLMGKTIPMQRSK